MNIKPKDSGYLAYKEQAGQTQCSPNPERLILVLGPQELDRYMMASQAGPSSH